MQPFEPHADRLYGTWDIVTVLSHANYFGVRYIVLRFRFPLSKVGLSSGAMGGTFGGKQEVILNHYAPYS